MAEELTPHFADVQAHYDLSDDFYRLFLDPTQTYSCAYFLGEDATLEDAQIAKIDLTLSKLGLQPGMTLLDIGCGWGATMRRAIERCDVNVIGLTLSKNQAAHVQKSFDEMDGPRSKRVLLNGWEQFDEPVDRIVSIGAFEHFGLDRYDDFFAMAHRVLPAGGLMLLHTITVVSEQEIIASGLPLTMDLIAVPTLRVPDSPPEVGYGLRDKEAAEGWLSLFDGKTPFGWKGVSVEGGALRVAAAHHGS